MATVSAPNVMPPMVAHKQGIYLSIPTYRNQPKEKRSIPKYASMYSCNTEATEANLSRSELTDE